MAILLVCKRLRSLGRCGFGFFDSEGFEAMIAGWHL